MGRPRHGGVHQFQSTLSLRRATAVFRRCKKGGMYFNPRSPCGERRDCRDRRGRVQRISIHALLAESDSGSSLHRPATFQISIHALLAESDGGQLEQAGVNLLISIHALLAESDGVYTYTFFLYRNFNPRSPCGERRQVGRDSLIASQISIHALLAESDRNEAETSASSAAFQSTLSLRRATRATKLGEDWGLDFNPRSPCGERPREALPNVQIVRISIHALLAESDFMLMGWPPSVFPISIHALLAESD